MRGAVSKVVVVVGVLLLLGSFCVPAEGQPAMVLGTDTSPPYPTESNFSYGSTSLCPVWGSTITIPYGSSWTYKVTFRDDESYVKRIDLSYYYLDIQSEEYGANSATGTSKTLSCSISGGSPVLGATLVIRVIASNRDGQKFDSCFYLKSFKNVYTLTISCNPKEGGTTDPAPGTYTYEARTSVSVTARANSGYTFTGWTGTVTSSSATITVTMDSDKTVTANFQGGGGQPPPQYYVNVTINGGGSVSKNPNKASYTWGESVTLTATPDLGWKFTGWSGDAGGNANPLTITVTKNYNITANFSRKDSPSGSFYINGQLVSPSGTLFLNTRTLTFKFIPKAETAGEITSARVEIRGPESLDVPLTKKADGSWENSWTLGKDGTYTITCKCRWELGDVTIAGISFGTQEEPVPPGYVSITYVCLPRIGGAIVGCRSPVPKGTHIELEAFPNQGWRFVGWRGDVPPDYTHPKLGFIASRDNMTIIAEFEAVQPVLSTTEAMRIAGGILILVGSVSWALQRRRAYYG